MYENQKMLENKTHPQSHYAEETLSGDGFLLFVLESPVPGGTQLLDWTAHLRLENTSLNDVYLFMMDKNLQENVVPVVIFIVTLSGRLLSKKPYGIS